VEALAKADLILITHDHFDHKDEKSIQLISKPETKIIIGGLANQILGEGWQNIKEGEEKEISGVKSKPWRL